MNRQNLNKKGKKGWKVNLALTVDSAAMGALVTGDYSAARPLAEESVALGREIGIDWVLRSILSTLGLIAYHQGEYDEAIQALKESLRLSRETITKYPVARCILSLSAVTMAQSYPVSIERAARLLGATESVENNALESWGPVERIERDRLVASILAQARADEQTWMSAYAEGRAMSMEQAIAYALEEDSA